VVSTRTLQAGFNQFGRRRFKPEPHGVVEKQGFDLGMRGRKRIAKIRTRRKVVIQHYQRAIG
jgi:hypothetical protein